MRRSAFSIALLAVSLVGPSALAAPPRTAPAAPAPAGPAALPAAPTVDDPMLAPVPRPKTEIAKWEDAISIVRSRSTDLRIAAQQVARADAAARIALAAALPTISATGTFTHHFLRKDSSFQVGTRPDPANPGGSPIAVFERQTLPFSDYLDGSVVLQQPVLALRAWYGIGTASRNEEAARLSFQDAKRVIAIAVANAMVTVVTAERLAELNRVGLRNALTRLELANRKTALGSGTGLDVVRARQDVETARATLVAGDESLRQAREALGLAVGMPEQVGVPPNVSLDGVESGTQQSCKPAGSIGERPDIASLNKRVEIAQRQVTDVSLQYAPTIDIRSTLSTTSREVGATQPRTLWNIVGVLTIPIWDGGVRYGNGRDAHAQEAIAGENLEAARRKAEIEITQAKRGVQVAEDRRRVAAESRDLAAENDRLTRTAYLEGRGTSLELVAAAQALREAEIQLALRDFELVKARVLAVLAMARCDW